MSVPKVSVILPVYNCENFISDCVNSILEQTFQDFELIIIDDKSTDNTLKIIQQIKDKRVNLIVKKKNSGYTNSLNLGIAKSKGEYIARIDGDDICMPNRFEKQVSFLDENKEIVACGSFSKIIGSDEIIYTPEYHEEIILELLRRNCIIHPSVMMRKSAINSLSVAYDVSKEPAEDYDLWVRLAKVGKLHNIQEVLLNYRYHENQVSILHYGKQKQSARESRFNLLNQLPFEKNEIELAIIMKFIENDINISFNEIVLFINKIKKKVLDSNYNNFFNQKGLESYLSYIEYETVKAYFLKRTKFYPSIFLNYINIHQKVKLKLSLKDEFKLMIKSLIFFNVKNEIN